MLLVQDIAVREVSRAVLNVSWSLQNHYEVVTDYRFTVLRSDAPEGSYTQVSPELTDTYTFNDAGAAIRGRDRVWYYRVRVRDTVSGDVTEYGSADALAVRNDSALPGGVSLVAPADVIALEARYRLELALQQFAGRQVLWFPRRRWGARCGCVDDLLGKQMIDDCRQCYRSEFVGGFHRPQLVWTNIGAKPERNQMSWIGKIHPGRVMAYCNGYYRPQIQDMFVEREGKRWLVESLDPTEKLRSRVRSNFVLAELPRSSVEFHVPVSWSATSLEAGPSKAYLPATDIESYRAEAEKRGLQ